MFEVDSVEHQPIDPQKNDEIEALQGINVTERYTTNCIYQELSSCKYIRLGVIPITLSNFVLPTFCIHRYQSYHSQMYRDLIWNSDYYEAYLSNIFLYLSLRAMIYITSAKLSAQALIPYATQIFSTFPTEEKHLFHYWALKLLSFSFFLLQQDIFLCYRLEDPKVTTDDITWMDEIIKNYGFKKHPVADMWTEQPSFEGRLGTENFKTAAEKAEQFFLKFNKNRGISPWELLQKVTKNQNYKLLKITAARYLLVTHILWLVSGKKLTACKEKRDNYTGIPQSWKIPEGGVCFPKPYGSATYKSDYDVGLIGKDSGTVTQKFNRYFEDKFKIPSELVFDTNVYAFTLEFAMPKMFPNLPRSFISDLHSLEEMGRYKMQELASAYYKVFKYNEGSFKVMKKGAIDEIKFKKGKKLLLYWLEEFEKLNTQVALRQMDTNWLSSD